MKLLWIFVCFGTIYDSWRHSCRCVFEMRKFMPLGYLFVNIFLESLKYLCNVIELLIIFYICRNIKSDDIATFKKINLVRWNFCQSNPCSVSWPIKIVQKLFSIPMKIFKPEAKKSFLTKEETNFNFKFKTITITSRFLSLFYVYSFIQIFHFTVMLFVLCIKISGIDEGTKKRVRNSRKLFYSCV